MRRRRAFPLIRVISFLFLLAAILLTTLQYIRFSWEQTHIPAGSRIAGVPVGGLDREQVAARLLSVYSLPVELKYKRVPIYLSPSTVDFQLDLNEMLAKASQKQPRIPWWRHFWDYLWGTTPTPVEIPLTARYSTDRLRTTLHEIALIYDQPPVVGIPAAGTVNFIAGREGVTLDVAASVRVIDKALRSSTHRSVDLPVIQVDPPPPLFDNLEIQLKQLIQVSRYDGLVAVYLLDLQTAQELHFAYQQGYDIPVDPDIPFSASSIIKIPIMISAFRYIENQPDPETLKLLGDMIDKSGNEAADWLMQRVIDTNLGPIMVSDDMKALGLENTFLAGYFTFGSPLLAEFKTPANQRTDINTDPDIYSQTTPSEIGMLLEDIYLCAKHGGGTLPAVFPDTITQAKCQMMTDFLLKNKLPSLLTSGIPDGTPIAHKHGWASVGGIITTLGDVGMIFSPGGDYVLVVFLYHPVQVVWEPSDLLVSQLSQAVYNYFNLSSSPDR